MRSRQSGCKVRRGDLERVRLAEKRWGLRLHNAAGTGSAPAAPGLGLLLDGPGTEPPGAASPGGAAQAPCPAGCPVPGREFLFLHNSPCPGSGSEHRILLQWASWGLVQQLAVIRV